jgi:hypothetical protein
MLSPLREWLDDPEVRVSFGPDIAFAQNPTPFTWTKRPEDFQCIIEATKEYQAANPKQPKRRKVKNNTIKN